MARLFDKSDPHVGRISNWWTVLGPGGVLATGYSLITANLPAIANSGWAAVALSAIGLALTTMLAVAALLAAWRFFRPLSHPSFETTSSVVPHNVPSLVTNELDERTANLRDYVDQKRKQLIEVMSECDSELELRVQASQKHTEDVLMDKLSEVQKELSALSAHNSSVHWDLLRLLDWSKYRASSNVVAELKNERPTIEKFNCPSDYPERAKIMAQASSWLAKIQTRAPFLVCGGELASAIINSKYEGNGELKSLPEANRPAHIDPYAFQDYFVLAHQCEVMQIALDRTLQFIENAELNHLQFLNEQFNAHIPQQR